MKGGVINRVTTGLAAWHRRHLRGVDFLHFAAIMIGLLAGFGAGLLKNGVDAVTGFIFSHITLHGFNIVFFILPIVGIFLATAFTTYVVKHPMDHASERIVEAMSSRKDIMSTRLIWGPIIGCSLTLGMGGSAGAEDPVAYTGAAIGSNVGRAFRIPGPDIGKLVGCGAAAAIAGIFMAPIGGVMFALEVLKMKQDLRTILAIVLSSLIAALTCYIMLGCHTDVTFVPEMRFDLHLIPWVLICGIICGFYSIYYRKILARCRMMFNGIKNRWICAGIGGLMLALMLCLFPSLYGEGYKLIGQLMTDKARDVVAFSPLYAMGADFDVLLVLMVVLIALKPMATSATNDSGGVGGDFTPTFFAGGVLGFLFAVALNHFFGMHLPVAIFAYFGMAAVMAGAVKAPLMAIFIASEITGLYGFILPLTIAAIGSFSTLRAFENYFPGLSIRKKVADSR